MSACPSASSGCAARRPAARARASARRRRAAGRTPPPRPCGRARRGTASGSARAALRSIMARGNVVRPCASPGRFDHRRDALVLWPGAGRIGERRAGEASAPSTAKPNPAASSSSRSFSPSPKATIRSEVEPQALGDEAQAGALRDARVPELEQVRQRAGEEEPCRRRRSSRLPRRAGSSSGSPTATSFVGGRSSQASSRPDLLHRQVLEVRVGAGVRRVLGDEQLVVDVDVRRVAGSLRARRPPRGRRRARSAGGGGTSPSRGSTTAAPW